MRGKAKEGGGGKERPVKSVKPRAHKVVSRPLHSLLVERWPQIWPTQQL